MRAVVQRVREATIDVAGERVASIGAGLVALIGIARNDSLGAADELARKLVHLRIFEDDDGRMNRSLLDTGSALALVSQFTLFGDTRKGRRPSYAEAAPSDLARPLFERLVSQTQGLGVTTVTGRFGEMMNVRLVNSGPVTLLIDTEKRF